MNRPALLRAGNGARMVLIDNASERGLGFSGADLPLRGDYVEVTFQGHVIVGRIVWSANDRCGICTQSAVDLGLLVSGAAKSASPAGGGPAAVAARPLRQGMVADGEFLRLAARLINWCAVLLIAGMAALLVAGLVHMTLREMAEGVTQALQLPRA